MSVTLCSEFVPTNIHKCISFEKKNKNKKIKENRERKKKIEREKREAPRCLTVMHFGFGQSKKLETKKENKVVRTKE